MAWRIDEAVIRGELDNRQRDRVTGRIWFAGRPGPVTLELVGNCWRDLAGRRLEFINLAPQPADLQALAAVQSGRVGDITASRKVKVPEIPMAQVVEYYAAKKPFPWHWGNSLYLEWFSEANGRVVIEATSYTLKIIGEPAWEMTGAEEAAQHHANGEAMGHFMEHIGKAVADSRARDKAEWNEKPQTEEEAEKMQQRSERLADRIQARLVREGEGADYDKILHEELEKIREEHGEPELTPEQLARNAEWIEEANRAAEAAANDPELSGAEDKEHPLAERAFEMSLRLRREAKAGGWLPEGVGEEHPIAELVNGAMIAGVKLAGALNGGEWPPEVERCAGIIVRLKRARGYLDDALRALESCQEQKLLETAWLGILLTEIVDLAHEADGIIAELRARLERGCD